MFVPTKGVLPNIYGFTVSRCANLEIQQSGIPTNAIKEGDPINIVVSASSVSYESEKSSVFIIPYDSSVDMTTSTVTNLTEKSLNIGFTPQEVYITTDGVFDRTITWENPTPGTYNIILDMDDDDTYTPYVDVVDNIEDYGFTVYSSQSSTDMPNPMDMKFEALSCILLT